MKKTKPTKAQEEALNQIYKAKANGAQLALLDNNIRADILERLVDKRLIKFEKMKSGRMGMVTTSRAKEFIVGM